MVPFIHLLRALLAVLGHPIDGFGRSTKASSPLLCEAVPLREGCLLIQSRNLGSVWFFSDNKHLIELCSSDLALPWEAAAIVEDIRS